MSDSSPIYTRFICSCRCTVTLVSTIFNKSNNQSALMAPYSSATLKQLSASSPRDEVCFQSQNITLEEKLTDLQMILQFYLEEIGRVRNKSLSEKSDLKEKQGFVQREHIRIFASNKLYFSQLANYSDVTTLLFKHDFCEMRRYLVQEYFHFSSNNCTFIDINLPDQSDVARHDYSIRCQEGLRAMLTGHPLPRRALQVGLPSALSHSSGEAVWTYVHVIYNGIVDPFGDVRTDSLTITPQRCRLWWDYGHKAANSTYEEVFVLSQFWGEYFFHSAIENIPRIAPYLPFLRNHPSIQIHHRDMSSALLGLLDIPDLHARQVSGLVRGRVVYLPAGTPCGRAPLFTTQLTSLYLQHRASSVSPPRPRNLIVLIQRSYKRFFKHHSHILEMLQDEARAHDLETRVFQDNPLPDVRSTMEMFHRAVMVVAPHGAGEANLLFSRPGTVVIEALCYDSSHRTNLCFRDLSQVLGLRHHVLIYPHQCMEVTAQQIREPVRFFLDSLAST